jgi:HEAT repeat protein
MLRAAREHAKDADVVVGAAAVADYRVYQPFHGKHRRDGEKLVLELIPNPDILQDLRTITKPDARRIGFAAEPTDDLTIAREKVYRKDLYAIAANDVSQAGIGFDADENELTLIFADGRTERSGRRTKLGCALWLLETALDEEMTPERARAWLAESQPLPADAPNDQTWRYVQAVLHLTQSPDPQAVPLLLGSLGEDHGMGVRETVLSLVEEADAAHAVPPLLAALRSEHPFRRALAAQAARAFPHEDVRAALLERLETEPDAETRTWIAYSLGEMADDAVTTALRTHIERETDEEVREAIEEVLGG